MFFKMAAPMVDFFLSSQQSLIQKIGSSSLNHCLAFSKITLSSFFDYLVYFCLPGGLFLLF